MNYPSRETVVPMISSPKILIYHSEAISYRQLLQRHFPDLEPVATDDEVEFRRHVQDSEILLGVTFPIDVLTDAAHLKWFHCTSAGVNFLLPARRFIGDIIVTNSRGIHGDVIADYVLGVIIMLHWDFPQMLRDQKRQIWRPKYVSPLSELTVGIIGLGSIGRVVAMRAANLGLRVLGLKRNPDAVDDVVEVFGPSKLERVLSASDFVVLAVPETPETHRMIGTREFSCMKSTAYVINVARGAIVDERALVSALRSGRIAGAALDVFEREPLPNTSPLWSMHNVIVTPHTAGNPACYVERAFQVFADNLVRWRSGECLRHVVDMHRGY